VINHWRDFISDSICAKGYYTAHGEEQVPEGQSEGREPLSITLAVIPVVQPAVVPMTPLLSSRATRGI